MERTVSKAKFKPRALAYFRQVEKTRKALIITDHGRPVLQIVPYAEDLDAALKALRGAVVKYDAPTDWKDKKFSPIPPAW